MFCVQCAAPLQPEWNACPICGERVVKGENVVKQEGDNRSQAEKDEAFRANFTKAVNTPVPDNRSLDYAKGLPIGTAMPKVPPPKSPAGGIAAVIFCLFAVIFACIMISSSADKVTSSSSEPALSADVSSNTASTPVELIHGTRYQWVTSSFR